MYKKLGEITPKKEVKNQVRGLLDRKIQEERPFVFPSVISKIYRFRDKNSIRWAEHEIRSQRQFSHVELPSDFPIQMDPFQGKIILSMKDPLLRAQTIVDRANQDVNRVISCCNKVNAINQAIANFDLQLAVSLADEFVDQFGISHVILRKIQFLASYTQQREAPDSLDGLLKKIDANKRDVIRPSLADAYNRKRQYLGVVSNIMNIAGDNDKSNFRKAISQFVVRPICYTQYEFSETLEAFSNYSLIDALYFISAHVKIKTNIAILTDLIDIWGSLDEGVAASLSCAEISQKNLQMYYMGESGDDESLDISCYRHLSAFIECDDLARLRALGDFYFSYEPETIEEPVFVGDLRKERFGQDISWKELVSDAPSKKNQCETGGLTVRGVLERTLAMAIFFARQELPQNIRSNEIISLMNSTTFADRILSKRALNELAKEARRSGDKLFQVIPLCLLAVDPKNTRDEFRLRRVLQDFVRENFDCNYVDFIRHIHDLAPQVGIYLYQVSTDEFLIQFYHLFDESSEAVECRALLHELMYEFHGDRRFKDLADSLRLSAKISKAREELDDSRIYVDLTRFGTWLKDNKLENMLTIIRSGALQKDALEKMNISMVNNSQGNEAELLMLLSECYKEFCDNRIFGIASFLGRRIRHGTLRGTLLQDFERSIDERFPIFFKSDACVEYYRSWKEDFEKYIKKIGSDFFHIRTTQKPKGMISPEITEGRKFGYLKAGATSILSAYQEYEDPDYFVRIISEMCWQITATDLRHSQQVLATCKATARIASVPESVKAVLGPAHSDFVRHINAKLDEKFSLVASWFNRPRITVPSVDLPTLLNVVQHEVSEEFNSYAGAQTDDRETKIELTGSAYHIVYDFLFVALKNAAEHGKPGGEVKVDVAASFEEAMVKQLNLTITSEYKEGDCVETVKNKIASCRLDALDTAYVEEGKSGLRKIKRLERDWTEVAEVSIKPSISNFVVQMKLELVR